MLDNALIALTFGILDAGLATIGRSNIKTASGYQPTQQGVNTDPTLYMYKIGPDKRIGTPDRVGVQGLGTATFTGSISNNLLTVTAVASGALAINQLLTGAGIPDGIIITDLGTGTGAEGTYVLNQPVPTVASESISSAGTWVYTETQQYSSLFQMSGLATQDPSQDPANQLTASDICNYAAAILQSQNAITSFEAVGVGILNITEVRNPWFTDDRQEYEASPSFDFVLTHKQIIITTTPTVFETDFGIYRV